MEDQDRNSSQHLTQFLTTEHFTLQGARNATISEANGRLGHYLSIVGSAIVALAFVANVSSLGEAFFAFALIILPVIILLGFVTLIRTMQINIDYARLTQAINRIRHYYVDQAPDGKPNFIYPYYDDPESMLDAMMPFHFPLQSLASTPGPVILINSVLAGVFFGIMGTRLFGLGLNSAILVSLPGLMLSLLLHMLLARRLWSKASQEALEVRFPPPE